MMKQVKFQNAIRTATLSAGLFLSASAFAQQITVKGHVVDETGEPVIGASVKVVGGKSGAVTDIDGNFSIAADKKATLEITYIGYEPLKVVAGQNLKIQLKNTSTTLNDVVVIGYGVAKKNDLTGSVTALKPDEKNHALVTSAQEMMQGKIAGVNVTTNNGGPGGGASIRIRGGSSLNASNDPLIVIDGMALDNQGVKGAPNGLGMVNPNDIESFTVLKDASATAIYGSRGSNGVIIITTKKGRGNQKPQVSYSGNVSMSMLANKYDVLNGDEYRNFVKSYYGEDSDAAKLLGTANTDWQDEIYRTAISTDHNVTVQGGLKNMPYRASLGYTDQNGILKGGNYQRYTASVNLSPSFFKDHLKLNINGKFMHAKSKYANNDAVGAALRMDPTQSVKADGFDNYNGYFAWTDKADPAKYPSHITNIANTNAPSNPVALLNEKDDRANSNDFLGNIEADYKIHGFEDLRIHANLSGDWASGKQTTIMADWGPSNFYWGNTGFIKESKRNLQLSTYAQYYKDFAKTQHIDVMGGYEWGHIKYWGNKLYHDMASEYGKTAEEIAAMTDKSYNSYSKDKWEQESYLVSFYGRLNYIAFDRYMFTATVRRDGSSRFKEHWATFPAFALGWKINEESFLKNTSWLDELKLRLGYGKTGQQDGIGNYNYFQSYNDNTKTTNGRYPMVGVGGGDGVMYRPDAYNEELKWETTSTYNVGLDFSVLRDRVRGSVDYYYRKTTDLLNDAYVPTGSNFRNKVKSNIGSLENKGLEASLTVRPIQTTDWQVEVTGNFTYNKNEITELTGSNSIVKTGGIDAGTGNECQAQIVGKPANSFYVYQQVYGVDGKPIEGVFVDRNGDGKIGEEDRYAYKSPAAPYLAGLAVRAQYKNWDFGFNFRGSFGNYVFNDRLAGYSNTEKRYDSSFACLQNSTPTSVANNWRTYNWVLSDYYVQNASFVKLDNITLGYSFQNLFKTAAYKGLSGRVYLTATNVATITKYDGQDPEVFGGIDNSIYPRPFSMTLGVNINF